MSTLTIPAVAYSNSVLNSCEKNAIFISPLKLQKLIYLSYAMHLKNDGEKIDDLEFTAWQYGPVVVSIYRAYKYYGSEIIRTYLKFTDGKQYTLTDDKNVVEAIQNYGHLHGYELIDLVHNRDGAWWKAISKKQNAIINHEDIKREFANV